MSHRFRTFVATTALAIGAVTFAIAQAPDPHHPGDPPKLIEPPANLPRPQTGDAKLNIDKLFEALKVAPTNESAKFVENRIWALWVTAGGDTGNLLMSRVKIAMDKKDFDLAIKLLNAITDIQPDYVEAWNRRAAVYFSMREYANALADLREVLAREPRHFGALATLGTIMQELGDDKRALEAFRRALAVHPKLEKIPDLVKKLTEKVEGRDI